MREKAVAGERGGAGRMSTPEREGTIGSGRTRTKEPATVRRRASKGVAPSSTVPVTTVALSRRRKRSAGVVVAILSLAGGLTATGVTLADAHGSVAGPPSRAYQCRFNAPDNPLCVQAWQDNPQARYDGWRPTSVTSPVATGS